VPGLRRAQSSRCDHSVPTGLAAWPLRAINHRWTCDTHLEKIPKGCETGR
jgi:hypothetical protein